MEVVIFNRLRLLNRGIALVVGAMLLVCAATVLMDIVLRKLGSSLGGTDEISGYVMAIATSWGMAYTLQELGHVRIDLLRTRTGKTARALFDLFAMTILSATIITIAIKAWPVVERSISNGSRANTPLETPLMWVQLPWFAGWLWFALSSAIITLAALSLVIRGRHDDAQTIAGVTAEHTCEQ